nr:hypothetical protein CFP56_28237 [Quercus suber]
MVVLSDEDAIQTAAAAATAGGEAVVVLSDEDTIPTAAAAATAGGEVKVKSRLKVSLRSLLKPWSLGEIAMMWDLCVRAVIS